MEKKRESGIKQAGGIPRNVIMVGWQILMLYSTFVRSGIAPLSKTLLCISEWAAIFTDLPFSLAPHSVTESLGY